MLVCLEQGSQVPRGAAPGRFMAPWLQHLLETRRGFGLRPSLFIEFPRSQVCRSDQSRLRLSGVRGEAGMGFAQGFAWVWGFWGIVLLAKVLGG